MKRSRFAQNGKDELQWLGITSEEPHVSQRLHLMNDNAWLDSAVPLAHAAGNCLHVT